MPLRRRPRSRALRVAGRALCALLALLVILVAAAWLALRGSLPGIDGEASASGLSASAIIERDAQGAATIRAGNRRDLAYATGYAHAQDRYFQMDLQRRTAAGELAGLIGEVALPLDLRNRLNRFRARAERSLAALPKDDRDILQAYADGANAGLASLRVRPFEYLLLREAPQPWRPEDSLLAIDAMTINLQVSELRRVLTRGALRDLVPDDLLTALTLPGSHWDATLDGVPAPTALPAVPATRPDWIDTLARQDGIRNAAIDTPPVIGSNAWAVDGRHGRDGKAIVANDMHLGLRLPNVWYRLTLNVPDGTGSARRVSGVSLPGAPVIVAGSNGKVAWGFTNSYGHFIDLVALEVDPENPRRYRDGKGEWREAVEHGEAVAVRGGETVQLPVRDTEWGPMIAAGGKHYAIRWAAHLDSARDLSLRQMESATDVPSALAVARASGIPAQNILVADDAGRIGWTLAGLLPAATFDPEGFPVTAAQAGAPLARLPAGDYPSLLDPALGRLWSGNSTQLSDAAMQSRIGDGGANVGVRSLQIRDALLAREQHDEASLKAIQLDDRASWVDSWRDLALSVLDDEALRDHPQRRVFRDALRDWQGHADADSAGYLMARTFHLALYDSWFGALDDRLEDIEPGLSVRLASSRILPLMEAVARAEAWRPARYPDWRSFMLDRVDASIAELTRNGEDLAALKWGQHNRLNVTHPFARLVPRPMAGWLSAPHVPMPGDLDTPRVQMPGIGASERFVVSPGEEEKGFLTMPGGASGHPLSPFFLAGHDAWEKGRTQPFLPGPPLHRLILQPSQ